jgi:hypothetical protein
VCVHVQFDLIKLNQEAENCVTFNINLSQNYNHQDALRLSEQPIAGFQSCDTLALGGQLQIERIYWIADICLDLSLWMEH